MAFMPLALGTRSDSTLFSRSRSPMSPASQVAFRMPSSRGNTSPHGFSVGHSVLSPRDRLSPTSLDRVSMQAFRPDEYPASLFPSHMTGEHSVGSAPRPQRMFEPSQDRRRTRARSQKRGHSPDHDSLLAIGSWSTWNPDREMYSERFGDFNDPVIFDNEAAAKDLSMDYSAPHDAIDDFVLFPDEGTDGVAEDALVIADEAPSPPRAPRITRLRTPDIAPLSTDVQFFPCLGQEREQDRINETWCLAGRDRVGSQLEDALAYMARVEGRRRALRD